MLSLSLNNPSHGNNLRDSSISTIHDFPGRTIVKTLGIVEGIANGLFSNTTDGSLDTLLERAKAIMTQRASDKGADAIVGFRYELVGRDIEKTVLVYGTAVQFTKL